jgi:hypothetical protein
VQAGKDGIGYTTSEVSNLEVRGKVVFGQESVDRLSDRGLPAANDPPRKSDSPTCYRDGCTNLRKPGYGFCHMHGGPRFEADG